MKGLHRNSLGLDLKPTTNLSWNWNISHFLTKINLKEQFTQKHGHCQEGTMSQTLAPSIHPKKPHSQLVRSWLHIWIVNAEAQKSQG